LSIEERIKLFFYPTHKPIVMKALFSALFMICFLSTAQSSTLSAEQLRSNLVANTWHEPNPQEWTGFSLMMEFGDNGIATVINNTHAEWPAMARYTWSIDVQRETPVLTFRNEAGSSFRFTAIQTPQGLDLLPFDAEMRTVIHLHYGKNITPAQWHKTQQTLLGAWENTLGATQSNSQVPQFRFNADGTYSLLWGESNRSPQERETGRWLLSKCSNFIIMMPHDSDTLEYAKVRLISADEMVVEQMVVSKGSLMLKNEVKNLFFNKL
jgi:hypothetical protein